MRTLAIGDRVRLEDGSTGAIIGLGLEQAQVLHDSGERKLVKKESLALLPPKTEPARGVPPRENMYVVNAQGGHVRIARPPKAPMDPTAARTLAARIMISAETAQAQVPHIGPTFEEIAQQMRDEKWTE